MSKIQKPRKAQVTVYLPTAAVDLGRTVAATTGVPFSHVVAEGLQEAAQRRWEDYLVAKKVREQAQK